MSIRLISCFLLLLQSIPVISFAALSNQLEDHPSPYLAMHGQDPVAWQDWSPDILNQAKKDKRIIFISSGYFSCHWCHVMQRESYQDKDVAKFLNQHFLPVKIDRELQPALDAHLIEFVELTRGQAGWPLNVFLTPDGYPLLGMTYLPKQQFLSLLNNLQQRWDEDSNELTNLARQGVEQIKAAKSQIVDEADQVTADPVQSFLDGSRDFRDELGGGFGQQTKFPMCPQLQLLLDLGKSGKNPQLLQFVRLTLDQMANLGLRDHLGEGFFRYSTDPGWQVPHFEKMLYDNAQLAMLYMNAGKQFDEPRYTNIGLATLDFVLNTMQGDSGAYVGSFSAVDDQGREGYYYLWNKAELESLLTDKESQVVQAFWSIQGQQLFDHGYLPIVQQTVASVGKQLNMSPAQLQLFLASAQKKLLAARTKRSLPVDTKQLTAWNGLLLSALATAYELSGEQVYRRTADRLAVYLVTAVWDGQQLFRATGGNGVIGQDSVEDYAMVASGLRDWARVGKDKQYQLLADKLVLIAWDKFYHEKRWFHSDEALLPGLGGKLAMSDNPLPSASATLTELALSQPQLKKDKQLQKKVQKHLQQVRQGLAQNMFWYAGYVELLLQD